jgi:hypothetical protein
MQAQGSTGTKPEFKLKGELLYRDQGKDNAIVNNDSYTNNTKTMDKMNINTQFMEGLHPPRLEESGDIVRRETKALMKKENKRCKHKLKELQDAMTQWNTHAEKGHMNTPLRETPTATYQNSMCPTGQALTA